MLLQWEKHCNKTQNSVDFLLSKYQIGVKTKSLDLIEGIIH